jgi:hypothetical protein
MPLSEACLLLTCSKVNESSHYNQQRGSASNLMKEELRALILALFSIIK